MLYNLLAPWADQSGAFNLFRYLTFRTGGAIMTALLISFVCGPWLIRRLKAAQRGVSSVREDVPDSHLVKSGVPSRGGFLILLALTASTLLWADLGNAYVWIALLVTLGFGLIGFLDDTLKLTRRGLPGRLKLLGQMTIASAAAIAYAWVTNSPDAHGLSIPFLKNVVFDLGWGFAPFMVLVIVGASNAVNLTDGLDGLAIVPVMIAAGCFGVIAWAVGNTIYAGYLQIIHVAGSGELAVFCGAMVGAALGFLWFNAPPAMVFMGDTGSLAMGGALGTVAVITKHELVLAIIGGLFVLETASVIVQVASFRLTGRRVFAMAPLHHHFEKKGWKESTIVIRFWIIASILALIGLASLKVR